MKPRIVSLLASGTEIVAALGLADRLVGISHECDFPPDILERPRLSRPRFDPAGLDSGQIDRAVREALMAHGSVYTIDAERLEQLRPDLILTQAVCDVCAVPTAGVREVAAAHGVAAEIVSLDAHTLADILGSILQVGQAAGAGGAAQRLVAGLRQRMERVRAAVQASAHSGRVRPRVLALEWLDPPFAPGHWVPEMIELAGGDNLLGEVGRPSREVAWQELAVLDPDVLVVMPCGYELEAARRDADRIGDRLREVAPRAVAAGCAYTVDASAYFNRSGPRVVRGVEILHCLLQNRLPAPDEAARWPA
jgi:iron complex transport system substrate-binding protein